MRTINKVSIGIGLAGSVLLLTWMLMGNRRARTKEFIIRGAQKLNAKIKSRIKQSIDPNDNYV